MNQIWVSVKKKDLVGLEHDLTMRDLAKIFARFGYVLSPIVNHCSTYLLFTYPFSTCLMSNSRLLTRSATQQRPSNNDAAPSLPADSEPQNPPTGKRKRRSKKEMEAARLLQAGEQQMVQDKLKIVNAQITNLEVTRSVDADLPTPRPIDSSTSAAGLRCSSSWAEITSLLASKKQGESTATAAAAGLAVDDSGTDDRNGLSDDNEDETPSKKKGRLSYPIPTPQLHLPHER